MTFKLLYPDFKPKAVTFSYDDGILQDKRTIEILKKYNLVGTFNLIYGMQREEKFRNGIDCSYLDLDKEYHLYDDMEIANHTYCHPHLPELNYEDNKVQFEKNRVFLEKLTGKKVYGAAYPYGTYNQESIKALSDLGIEYCRDTKSTYDFSLPNNWLLWHPTIHHNDPKLRETLDKFYESQIELACFYLWGHSYEFALQDNFSILDDFCKEVSKRDDIYSATNHEIYDYVHAAEMVYYRDHGFHNPSWRDVYLEVNGNKVLVRKGERLAYE